MIYSKSPATLRFEEFVLDNMIAKISGQISPKKIPVLYDSLYRQ